MVLYQQTGFREQVKQQRLAHGQAVASSPSAGAYSDPVSWRAPVLPSTLLCLQMLLTQPCLDLRAATNLLRRDPGAVLRLYALVAEECPDCADRPERLEDCIASVGISELARALQTGSEGAAEDAAHRHHAQLMHFAQHALAIAEYAEMVAASLALCEDRAYLVGLLHALGGLPARLELGTQQDGGLDAVAVARHWTQSHSVPSGLCHAIDEVHRELPDSVWVAMVRAAHDLARQAGQIR